MLRNEFNFGSHLIHIEGNHLAQGLRKFMDLGFVSFVQQ